ncbi:MAG: DUF177 domain-containing protein [Rhizobiales bacterium]|nr:DUF177 domain-containing protein [Hyphomicrobiales bacterium]
MSKSRSQRPWSVPVAMQDVPAEGLHRHLVADAPTRAGIARLAGLPEIVRLEADIDTVPHGTDGLRVTGRLSATVGLTCVVTLDPMQSEVDEPIDLLFLRDLPDRAHEGGGADEEAGNVGDERIERLVGGGIDLGAIATEFLILGIDPYPRKPDAVFAAPAADGPQSNPFAALATLKKASDQSGG